ncbi:MAG TPA: ATPase [Epulopiscium sp.]|nr:ATPase [Candidatus Epulonipiscium sp.]
MGTIIYGVTIMRDKNAAKNTVTKKMLKNSMIKSVSAFSMIIIGAFIFLVFKSPVYGAEAAQNAAGVGASVGDGLKYIAAALSTGLATIGTGLAVGSVGSSALGAVSEDPAILGKTLIFVGMAEGIAIYGMIISILILFV